jgi:PHD-finger
LIVYVENMATTMFAPLTSLLINQDDGTFTVACEKCEIWQHVACLPDPHDLNELYKRNGAPEGTYPDYEFICSRCKRKAKDAEKAEAVKTKEQLKKEREREINRAKYERRKIREKAKKEEEKRRREEELKIAGRAPGSPSTQIRNSGLPSIARSVGSGGLPPFPSNNLLYSIPSHFPPTPLPTSSTGSSHLGSYPISPHQSPTSPSSSPYSNPTRQTTGPHPLHNNGLALASERHPPVQLSPSLPQRQPFPPKPSATNSSSHYQPVRPAIQPYWSPYTTGSTLPNGQTFHSPAVPYLKDGSPSNPARNLAAKPVSLHAQTNQLGYFHPSTPLSSQHTPPPPDIQPGKLNSAGNLPLSTHSLQNHFHGGSNVQAHNNIPSVSPNTEEERIVSTSNHALAFPTSEQDRLGQHGFPDVPCSNNPLSHYEAPNQNSVLHSSSPDLKGPASSDGKWSSVVLPAMEKAENGVAIKDGTGGLNNSHSMKSEENQRTKMSYLLN